jgi:putative ribosome biogenesis GTPase RsgA
MEKDGEVPTKIQFPIKFLKHFDLLESELRLSSNQRMEKVFIYKQLFWTAIKGEKMILKDKVSIITGAGSGMGKSTALLFAAEGSKVVVVDVVAETGLETVRMIKEKGGEAIFIKADRSIAPKL